MYEATFSFRLFLEFLSHIAILTYSVPVSISSLLFFFSDFFFFQVHLLFFRSVLLREPFVLKQMQIACAVIFAVLVFVHALILASADTSAAYHRCIHGHSRALQNTTRDAAKLEVEYVTLTTSNCHSNDDEARSVPVLADTSPRSVSELSVEERHRSSPHYIPSAAASAPPFRVSTTSSPIRIHFDVSHLFNSNHFCTFAGDLRDDKLGGSVTCGPDDVFSVWKRDFVLHRLLPLLSSSVEQWLSVREANEKERESTATITTTTTAPVARATRVIVPQDICGPHVIIPVLHSTKGVYNTDFIVYVLAAPLHDAVTTTNAHASAPTSSRTIAWATYCAVDRRTERPLVAVMDFVPSALVIEESVATTVAAANTGDDGSSSASLLWRRTVGRALRPLRSLFRRERVGSAEQQLRNAVYDANEAMTSYYAQWTAQHYRSLLHELLHALGFTPTQLRRYTMSRASPFAAVAESGTANAVSFITASTVRAAVQRWMNCTSTKALPGAALERSGPDGTVGAHWERLQFRDDLMAGVLLPSAALSNMTIAFFDALPYYRADQRYAEHPMWGYQAGCGFAVGACTPLRRFAAFAGANASSALAADADAVTRAKYWCEATASSSAGHAQCTSDRRAIGLCFAQRGHVSRRAAIRGLNGDDGGRQPLAAPATESRGLSLLMEGCPVVEPYANRLCDSATVVEPSVDGASPRRAGWSVAAGGGDVSRLSSTPAADAHYQRRVLVEDQGYYFGPYSRCFASSDVRRLDRSAQRALKKQPPLFPTNRTTDGDAVNQTPTSHTLVSARCLQTRCVRGGAAVKVRVGAEWIACPADGTAGIVSVPPASGYMGWIGCEPAVLYCADAAQLQRPAQLVRVTPPTISEASPSVLPFYRVTAIFSLSLNVVASSSPLVQRSATASSAEPAVNGAEAAAAFRMAIVDSDRAFQAALQRDLTRHRARRGRTPFGAVMGQRFAGATRLAGATLAVFLSGRAHAAWVAASPVNDTTPFPLYWKAVVVADLEVVARGAEEALASTRAWFPVAIPNGGSTADVAFPSIAEWLSRVSCAASALCGNKSSTTNDAFGEADTFFPATSSLLPVDSSAAELATSVPAMCHTRNPVQPLPITWDASARDETASFAVVGPLDVSELNRGSTDLREVAVLHLRLRLGGQSKDRTGRATPASPVSVSGNVALNVVEGWVSQTAALLALTKDVGALLGLSAQLVRVASIRHMATREQVVNADDTNATLTGGATDAPFSSAAASASALRSVDIGFVVSFPAADEVPRWFTPHADNGAGVSNAATSQTWAEFTEAVRADWQRQLVEVVERTAAGTVLCALRHASSLFFEQQLHQQGRPVGANSTVQSSSRLFGACPVALDAVVSVRAPQPGASLEDLFLDSAPRTTAPWWRRRVIHAGGFTVTAAAVLGSFAIAGLMLWCAYRHSR